MTHNRFGDTTDPAAVRSATIEAIEAGGAASASEFDLDAIVDAQVSFAARFDGDELTEDEFWGLVFNHAR